MLVFPPYSPPIFLTSGAELQQLQSDIGRLSDPTDPQLVSLHTQLNENRVDLYNYTVYFLFFLNSSSQLAESFSFICPLRWLAIFLLAVVFSS